MKMNSYIESIRQELNRILPVTNLPNHLGRYDINSPMFTDEIHKKINNDINSRNVAKTFLPKNFTSLLRKYDIDFFCIPFREHYNEIINDMDELKKWTCDIVLSLLRAFWLGYIAILEDISTTCGQYNLFLDNFENLFVDYSLGINYKSIPFRISYGRNINCDNTKKLIDKYRNIFLSHYFMEIFFSKDPIITGVERMNLLDIIDRNNLKENFNIYQYDLSCNSFKNALPRSFGNFYDDMEFNSNDINKNPEIMKIKIDPLKTLTEIFKYKKYEIFQILHVLFRILNSEHRIFILGYVLELRNYRNNLLILDTIFGERCSFKNKGVSNYIGDDFETMTHGELCSEMRDNKRKIHDLEEKINKVCGGKENLINIKVSCLVAFGNSLVDPEGVIMFFGINPLLPYNNNKNNITNTYKKLALENHPDKGGDEEKMKHLGNMYDHVKDENLYGVFINSCYKRARDFIGDNIF